MKMVAESAGRAPVGPCGHMGNGRPRGCLFGGADWCAAWPIAEGTGLLQDVVPHPYGIHGVLEDRGHTMARIQEDVSARMPTPDERDRLGLPPRVPVLDVLHTSIDQDGEAYELTRFVLRADLSGLRYDVPVE